MRFAQRIDGRDPSAQQVEVIIGDTARDVGLSISELVARYAIRVVALDITPGSRTEKAVGVVVFEEEPLQR